jgi:hypothetical protein
LGDVQAPRSVGTAGAEGDPPSRPEEAPVRAARLAAIAAAASLSLAAGCSNEVVQEAAERSADPVVASTARLADERSARIALSVAVDGAPALMRGEGVAGLGEGGDGTMTMVVQAPGAPPQEMEFRAVDGTSYVRVPGLEAQQPGKRWLRVDPAAPAAPRGPADAMAQQDPLAMVRLLESAADFEEAGAGEVRGDPVTLHRGVLDLAELAEAEEPGAAGQLRDMGLAEVPAEVAIDDDGLLRRVAFTLDLAALAAASGGATPGGPAEATFTVELFDFGTPVEVKAPPAAEVTDVPAGAGQVPAAA